jgi:hypothetical protein
MEQPTLGKRTRDDEEECELQSGDITKQHILFSVPIPLLKVETSEDKDAFPDDQRPDIIIDSPYATEILLPLVGKKDKPRANDEQARAKAWDEKLQELKRFREIHGHLNVPRYSADWKSLCHWTRYQRERKQSGKLTQNQIEALEELGFQWMTQKDSWEENYDKLKKFQEIHNTCCVPYKVDKHLNIWVHTQRATNRENTLSLERKRRLDELGFKWTMKDRELAQKEGLWQEHYEQLKKFKEIHGHMNPTREVDRKLDRWVRKQRETYKSGLLSKDRIQKLEELGFQWSLRGARKSWDDYYNKLKEYKEKNGHLNVTRREDRSLHMWVNSQKVKMNLKPDQMQKLQELGFQWPVMMLGQDDESAKEQLLSMSA